MSIQQKKKTNKNGSAIKQAPQQAKSSSRKNSPNKRNSALTHSIGKGWSVDVGKYQKNVKVSGLWEHVQQVDRALRPLERKQTLATGGVDDNPFVKTVDSGLVRCDITNFQLHHTEVATSETFKTKLATQGRRIVWPVPGSWVNEAGASAVTNVDYRGTLLDVDSAKIRFENVLNDDIVVYMNSPRSTMADQELVAARKDMVAIRLKPKESYTRTITWGTKGNLLFPSLVNYVYEGTGATAKKRQGLILADFVVVTANTNQYTGDVFNNKRNAVEITAMVEYMTTNNSSVAAYAGSTRTIFDSDILLQDLGSVSLVFRIEPALIPVGKQAKQMLGLPEDEDATILGVRNYGASYNQHAITKGSVNEFGIDDDGRSFPTTVLSICSTISKAVTVARMVAGFFM